MRKILVAVALVGLFFSTSAFAGDAQKAILDVKGMTCVGCSAAIQSKVKKIDGISSVIVDLKAGKATIEYDAEKVTPEKVAEKINEMGYKASISEDQEAKSKVEAEPES